MERLNRRGPAIPQASWNEGVRNLAQALQDQCDSAQAQYIRIDIVSTLCT